MQLRSTNSPAVSQLGEAAKDYAKARGADAVKKVGDKLTGVTGSLNDTAESGGFKATAVGEAAQAGRRRATTRSRRRSAASASGIKEKVKGSSAGARAAAAEQEVHHRSSRTSTSASRCDVAYDQWTQFQEFASFTKGVESVDQADDVSSNWQVKVVQVQPELEGARSPSRSPTADRLDDRGRQGHDQGRRHLPPARRRPHPGAAGHRVLPQGLFEKTGNIWRAQGRRARLDLKHFRRFMMMRGEATGSWRGEIRDGEVVREPDEDEEDERGRRGREDRGPRTRGRGPRAGDEEDDEERPRTRTRTTRTRTRTTRTRADEDEGRGRARGRRKTSRRGGGRGRGRGRGGAEERGAPRNRAPPRRRACPARRVSSRRPLTPEGEVARVAVRRHRSRRSGRRRASSRCASRSSTSCSRRWRPTATRRRRCSTTSSGS